MNHFTMKPIGLMEIWRNNPQNLPRGHTSMKERDIISMATELCILEMVKKCINTKINVSLTWKMEKKMATLSRTLAWKLPWTEEPGGLQSMRGEESDTTEQLHFHFFTFMHWRRKRQPTPVLSPGESQGREPGGLLSMGSHRGGHDWNDLAAAAVSWKRLETCSQDEYQHQAACQVLEGALSNGGCEATTPDMNGWDSMSSLPGWY